MISIAIFLMVLDAVLFFELAGLSCRSVPTFIVAGAIGALAIYILGRTIHKMKMGRFEKTTGELAKLRQENKDLLERIASIREQEILKRTDEDLV